MRKALLSSYACTPAHAFMAAGQKRAPAGVVAAAADAADAGAPPGGVHARDIRAFFGADANEKAKAVLPTDETSWKNGCADAGRPGKCGASRAWACARCTLLNAASAKRCGACDALPAGIPAEPPPDPVPAFSADRAAPPTAHPRDSSSRDLNETAPSDVPTRALRMTLADESASLWDRYGAMFALRNRGDPSFVAKCLGSVLVRSNSALLKHEACYVLGQIQEKGDDGASAALRATLENAREHPMVRHEAAEAIGSIAAEDTRALLLRFRDDQDRIVAESCEVALDIMQSEISGEFVPLVVEPPRAAA